MCFSLDHGKQLTSSSKMIRFD